MAEGDELRGLFGGHGSRDDCGIEDGPFFGAPVIGSQSGHYLGAEADEALGDGDALGDGFFGDVDHGRFLMLIDVGEVHGEGVRRGLNIGGVAQCQLWKVYCVALAAAGTAGTTM